MNSSYKDIPSLSLYNLTDARNNIFILEDDFDQTHRSIQPAT